MFHQGFRWQLKRHATFLLTRADIHPSEEEERSRYPSKIKADNKKAQAHASTCVRVCARANVPAASVRPSCAFVCRPPLNATSALNWAADALWHCEPQVQRNKRAPLASKRVGDIWGFQSSKCYLLL